MFGQAGNPSFGFNTPAQSSPFGQSAFGKTIATTSFGTSAPPVFGSNTSLFSSKPPGSSTGNLFGNTTTTPTFGASTATQSSFGGFVNTNTSTPLFGTQQNANTNLFGTSNSAPAFGQTNKPATFGFGQPAGASLFGQPQQQVSQQTTPFGQVTATGNTGLFGTTSGFGSTNSVTGISGTIVKFSPVTGTDTMVKNGVTQTISTRHHCITCMNEYETKSLEELRLEDYTAGRKGVVQGQSHTIFGTATQSSPFGTPGSNSNTSNTGFGAITGGFGSASQSSNSSLFSKSIASFGTPSTTSSAFAFNPTTSSNLFNTQAKPFGATTATPLFASSNTSSSPGTAFGNINTQNTGFGTVFSSGQSNQSIGLYTQNKPAFNMPLSNSSNFAFGQSTANSGNLFSAKPIGTGFGTAFGGVVSSTLQGGNTGFGSVPNTNSSLFSSSFKPTGQSAGFTFGNTSSITSTGLGSSGTSLFNSSTKPNLFGNTSATTTFNTTGTFGSVPTFGSTNGAISTLGTNLFGTGMCINNVQNNNGPVPVHQQILALVSAPFGDSPLLKNLLPASGKSEQFLKPSNTLSKGLSSPHYKILSGNNVPKLKPKVVTAVPLSKKSLFDGLEDEDPLLEAFQPRQNTKRLVLRPKLNSLIDLPDKSLTSETCNNSSIIVHQMTDKESENQENNRLLDDRRSSNSWLKSSLHRKSKKFDEQYSNLLTRFSSPKLPTAIVDLENTITEFRSATSVENYTKILHDTSVTAISELKNSNNLSICETKPSSELDEISNSTQIDELINKANIKLQRYGYYTIPSLDIIQTYVSDKTCIVPHFTVGRKGYGNVYFADSFDIYGLNLDEIVHFRHKEVIIYPDDNIKPPIGQGLNRKAQVTLDRVWPHDKSCHEPITDPKRLIEMDYEGKLRRVSAKHDTRFLEYRPETGSWVFRVDHFSKYGLSDSDDDEANISTNKELKKMKSAYKDSDVLKENSIEDTQYTESIITASDNNRNSSCDLILQQSSDGCIHEKQYFCSPTAIQARLLGTESHTLQLMKASFFELVNDNLIQDALVQEQRHFEKNKKASRVNEVKTESKENTIQYSIFQSTQWLSHHLESKDMLTKKNCHLNKTENLRYFNKEKQTRKLLVIPSICPKVAVLKFRSGVPPFNHYIMNNNRFKYIADTGIQMGNIFRPSWGSQLTLISLSTQQHAAKISLYNTVDQLGSYISGRQFDDITSTNIVQRLQILGGSNLESNYIQTFKISVEGHLNIQLEYSTIEESQDNLMIKAMTGESSIHALYAHKVHSLNIANGLQSDSLMTYFCNVWGLCESLWGKRTDFQLFSSNISHETVMFRKKAFSEWLKHITGKIVQQEISTMETNDQIIFSLLSANKLKEACNKALKAGDHCLALLLSQLNGNLTTRELIKQQIELWKETSVDKNLIIHRLKLFMLVAGIPIIFRNNETINVCENLDWKRCLAIHLWYLSHPAASITDALDLYDTSFTTTSMTGYSLTPRPDYFENDFETEINSGKCVYDLCYHLLKLYCTGNYSLEAILNPQTYTYDPLDYRLSWLLLQSLTALGYAHVSEQVVTLTHSNFATQLETFDLWHWAIFVVLHFQDPSMRYRAVIDLLLRHVKLDKTSEYEERENFLIVKIKIPLKWINQAKAIKSCSMKRYGEAAWYFIHAQDWNKAHEIIMKHLATEAIINEDHDYLRSLLNLLQNTNCYHTISGWNYQGQLILDYVTVTSEIKDLLIKGNNSNVGYKLELLQPQLISLCTKITLFPCPTTKHRLCQAEMAKRTLQLARSLLMLQHNEDNTSDFLVHLISQLPLPEDYVQQELRPIISICAKHILQ